MVRGYRVGNPHSMVGQAAGKMGLGYSLSFVLAGVVSVSDQPELLLFRSKFHEMFPLLVTWTNNY